MAQKKTQFRSPLARAILRLTREKLTQKGRFLCMALILACFMSMSSVLVPIFHLGCVMIAIFIITICAGYLLRPRIEVVSFFPKKTSAHETLIGSFRLINRSHFAASDISARFFRLPDSLDESRKDPFIRLLEPGKSQDIRMEILAVKRGFYELPPLRPFSTFPFDIMRTKTRCNKNSDTLFVLPTFHPAVDINVPTSARYQPGGIALTSNIGESPEYIGNRDYRHGDPLKHIDFRSWARLGKPVVREFQEEYYCRIALIFDTFVPAGPKEPPEGFSDFEASVSLTAAVADVLGRGEHVLDLFAAGPELYVFRSGRSTAHFENVLEILACVEACRANPFDTVTAALTEEFSNISTVICILLDWDTSREKLCQAAALRGCDIKILIVRDGPTTMPVDSAAGEYHSILQMSIEDVTSGRYEVL